MDAAELARMRKEAEECYAQGKLGDALSQLERLNGMSPNDPEVLNDLGTVCFAMGRGQESVRWYVAALQRDKDHKDARANFEYVCRALGMDPERTLRDLCSPRSDSFAGRVEELFAGGKYQEAYDLARQWTEAEPRNAEAWNDAAVAALQLGRRSEAVGLMQQASDLAPDDKAIRENLGEMMDYVTSGAPSAAASEERPSATPGQSKPRILFIETKGLGGFLTDLVGALSKTGEFEMVHVLVPPLPQDLPLGWADIVWIEWAENLAIEMTNKLSVLRDKKVICRLHRYEAFTDMPRRINWDVVDRLIFVSRYVQGIFRERFPSVDVAQEVLYNGVDMDRFAVAPGKKNARDIAFVAHLNYRKNLPLLFQIARGMVDAGIDRKIFIAGDWQIQEVHEYYDYMRKEMKLEGVIVHDGYVRDVGRWLDDKRVMLSTSINEGHPCSILEGMAAGLTPVIHNYPGVSEAFPPEYVFNTVAEAVRRLGQEPLPPAQCRAYAQERFSREGQVEHVRRIFGELLSAPARTKRAAPAARSPLDKAAELVHSKTVFGGFNNLLLFVPTHDRARMVIEDIEDGHKLGQQRKIIVDDFSRAEDRQLLKDFAAKKDVHNVDEIIFREQNGGISQTKADAARHCRQRYICGCDDDDMYFFVSDSESASDVQKFLDQKDGEEEQIILMPRYTIDLDTASQRLSVGFDKGMYDGKCAGDVLKHMVEHGDVGCMLLGAMVNCARYRESLPEPLFRVAEDFVFLVRLFGKAPQMRVKVTEGLMFVRRRHPGSLTAGKRDVNYVSQDLLATLIGGYYCLSNSLMGMDEVVRVLERRADVFQARWGIGRSIGQAILAYVAGREDEIRSDSSGTILASAQIPAEVRRLREQTMAQRSEPARAPVTQRDTQNAALVESPQTMLRAEPVRNKDEAAQGASAPYIFVGGSPRSGTTLINLMLCQTDRTNPFIPEAHYLHCLMWAYHRAKEEIQNEIPEYFDDVADFMDFHRSVVEGYLRRLRQRYPAARTLVLKDPKLTPQFPDLFDLCKDAQFVCIMRDFRDIIASHLKVGRRMIEKGESNQHTAMVQSRDIAGLCRFHLSYYLPALISKDEAFRRRTLFVRYEDLVLKPAETAAMVQAFTGLSISCRTEEQGVDVGALDVSKREGNPWFSDLYGKKIDASRVGTYAESLSAREIEIVERECSALFKMFGYSFTS